VSGLGHARIIPCAADAGRLHQNAPHARLRACGALCVS
jgi:hypothetical protein